MPKIQRIAQLEIEDLTTAEEDLKAIRKASRSLEAKIANIKHQLISRLDDGAKVEKGRYTLAVEEAEGRISISWKDLYLSHQEEIHNIAPKLAEEEARKLFPPEKQRVLVIGVANIQITSAA